MEARSTASPANPPTKFAENLRDASDASSTSSIEVTLNTGSPRIYALNRAANLRLQRARRQRSSHRQAQRPPDKLIQRNIEVRHATPSTSSPSCLIFFTTP